MQELTRLNSVSKTWPSANLLGAFVAIEFALLLTGLLLRFPSVITAVLILLPIVLFSLLDFNMPAYYLIIATIFTEFCWIEIFGGYLKPFHIVSVYLLLTLSVFYLNVLKPSRIARWLGGFVVINIISILISENYLDSLRSFILPVILMAIAINVAIILYKNRIPPVNFRKLLLYGSIILVIFSLLQMIGYRFFGIHLNLTDVQLSQIVINKRPPSFFTEADTFGKFLSFPLFLFLPFALEEKRKSSKYFIVAILIFIIGIIINMTRSAMIGIGITMIIYVIYSLSRKSLTSNIAVLLGTLALLMILLPFAVGMSKALGSHDELSYRFQTLVSPSQLMTDGSTRFRMMGIEETFKGTFDSISVFLFGHGWGQSLIQIREIPRNVSCNLLLNILYYSGIFALLIFLWFCYRVLKILFIVSKNRYLGDGDIHLFAEGLFFCFLCMLIISQLAAMWIAPEFWLVIGCAIYLELWYNRENKAGRYVR